MTLLDTPLTRQLGIEVPLICGARCISIRP